MESLCDNGGMEMQTLRAFIMEGDALAGTLEDPSAYNGKRAFARLKREYHEWFSAEAEDMREQRELRERLILSYPVLPGR